MGRTNPSFLNGVPELLVLRLLADREMYGYELVRAIQRATGEAIRLGEGVVYPALHALEAARCLTSRRCVRGGRSRVYYRVTAKGKKRLAKIAGDWQTIATAVSRVLGRGLAPDA